MVDIADLLKMAEDICSGGGGEDQLVDKIVHYTDLFEIWHEENKKVAGAEGAKADRAVLERLSRQHAAVLEKALGLRDNTSLRMRKLKTLVKGILAYTDVLPKKITTIKPRKW